MNAIAPPLTLRQAGPTAPLQDAAGPMSFGPAVLPHLDAAYNLARWLTGDAVLAEDVVQEAALRALRHFPSFRGSDARAWLLRIVRNAAYSTLKQRRADNAISLSAATDEDGDERQGMDLLDPELDPEARLAKAQGSERLDAALSAMPARLRECLVLREMEELSYREIAEIAQIPIGTVMSRLWGARQTLMGYVAAETHA